MPATSGVALLREWRERVDGSEVGEMEDLAELLVRNPHRLDEAMWIPLIARWAEEDAPAMMAFLEVNAPPPLKAKLMDMAWFSWGAANPDAAVAAGKDLPTALVIPLLEGMAETDLRKAALLSLEMANSQFPTWSLAERISKEDPDLAEMLVSRAIYDGGRIPLQRATITRLASEDPEAAISYARSLGVIGSDPVPGAVVEIAKIDPLKAAVQVEAMPSSRSKALSSVKLAATWAASDPEAATEWIQQNLQGSVNQAALLEAASVSGSLDPEKALDLVLRAGWTMDGNFFAIRDFGTMNPSESRDTKTASSVTANLLRQWAAKDPEAARFFLQNEVPATMREDIAKSAGLEP